MILNYTVPRAEENILAGIKIHSMREDKTDRWKPGRLIHHTTGSRTKKYKCFLKNNVVATQLVLIVFDKVECTTKLTITVDRQKLSQKQTIQLALNDGFYSIEDFVDWFFPRDKKKGYRKRTMWSGKLIHWTDLKYTTDETKKRNRHTALQGKLIC